MHPSEGPGDLSARIEAHPGTAMIRALDSCEAARDTFEVSALQLRRLILALEDAADPLGIRSGQGVPDIESARPEIFRRLLQFAAAAEALAQQTRLVMAEDFESERRRDEHARAIDVAFGSDPLARFIRDFRHYVRERGHPKLSAHSSPHLGQGRLAIYIEAMELLSWQYWSTFARRYLHQHQPRIPVLGMIDVYEQKTRTFRHRFAARFREHHHADIEAASALIEELHGPSVCPLPPPGFSS